MADDPENAWAKREVASRIVHEDEIFAARANQLLVANSFLVFAFAAMLVGSATTDLGLESMALALGEGAVAYLGIFLCVFHLFIGRRHGVSIVYWREMEKELISAEGSNFKVTPTIFDHRRFLEFGEVPLKFGRIQAAKEWVKMSGTKPLEGRVMGSFPWTIRRMGSTNRLTGEIFPAALAVFWTVLSFTVAPFWNVYGVSWFGILTFVVVVGVLLCSIRTLPYFPQWTNAPVATPSSTLSEKSSTEYSAEFRSLNEKASTESGNSTP